MSCFWLCIYMLHVLCERTMVFASSVFFLTSGSCSKFIFAFPYQALGVFWCPKKEGAYRLFSNIPERNWNETLVWSVVCSPNFIFSGITMRLQTVNCCRPLVSIRNQYSWSVIGLAYMYRMVLFKLLFYLNCCSIIVVIFFLHLKATLAYIYGLSEIRLEVGDRQKPLYSLWYFVLMIW